MTDAPLDATLARLDALVWRLGRGEFVSGRELHRVADEAAALGPSLEEGDRSRLVDGVRRVSEALAAACGRIKEQQQTLARGRRAGRAYLAEAP